MIRKIIEIDETLCNGCALCATACHESAISMVDGKAKLMRDDYCDGLGDCLPVCPTGAIQFVEREAPAYDDAAVKKNIEAKQQTAPHASACPGSMAKQLAPRAQHSSDVVLAPAHFAESMLQQWPIQIQLAPLTAPYFENANLLIAADCTAYAYANFHRDFIQNHITLIGCPKLDSTDYSQKLKDILQNNKIKSLTVARMEVPCCGGIVEAVKAAIKTSGKIIPWSIVVITIDGNIVKE